MREETAMTRLQSPHHILLSLPAGSSSRRVRMRLLLEQCRGLMSGRQTLVMVSLIVRFVAGGPSLL